MEGKVLGRQSFALGRPPAVLGEGSVVGEKEGAGPLGNCFDLVSTDAWFGEKSWEKAESAMLRRAFHLACHKAGVSSSQIQLLFAGDLLNQCVSSAFAVRESAIPYFGLYGACSTMAESLALAAMCLDGGFGSTACAMTSSHFCSAERQFRFPLNYGGQRCPTAQWTVTGAGAVILRDQGPGPYVTHVTVGHVVDAGITDAGNMGAASGYKYEVRIYFDTTLTEYFTAEIIGGDSRTDLALLKTSLTGLVPVEIADSDTLTIGESVVVMGCGGGI